MSKIDRKTHAYSGRTIKTTINEDKKKRVEFILRSY